MTTTSKHIEPGTPEAAVSLLKRLATRAMGLTGADIERIVRQARLWNPWRNSRRCKRLAVTMARGSFSAGPSAYPIYVFQRAGPAPSSCFRAAESVIFK